jgi:thiamine-phosphate pyrophosphorylase
MIPKLHYVANATTAKEQLENTQKACSAGVELIQLDVQHIAKNKRLSLAQEIHEIATHYQTRLIITSDYALGKTLKADGVFLEKKVSCPTLVRKNLHSWQSLGALAYTLEDCITLIDKEVDYIALGPFKSGKESDAIPLSIDGYTTIIEALNTETPILAYGNVTASDVKSILATGISGICVDEAITADFNSIKTFHQLLHASSTQEMRHTFEKK